MSKSADAFRTISEVAEWLDTPAHVLRFWESKFRQVKPVKRAGGRRYYRPTDMQLLGGIKQLLHEDGMTIKAVQKLLRDEGVSHVSEFSQPLGYESEEETIEGTISPQPVKQKPIKDPEPVSAEIEDTPLAFSHRERPAPEISAEPELPSFLSASLRKSEAEIETPTARQPLQVDVPDDPADDINAPQGVLGRIGKLPRPVPTEVADQLQPLIARLRGRNDTRT
ncbi:MAG: MerR family transcriptional regulator [Pseudomonadota bacterium]